MKKTILYIAGPMSGIRQFNYPAFSEAAVALRAEGYAVICPPESDSIEVREAALASETGDWADLPDNGDLLREIIQQNVEDVLVSDGLATLEGWKKSAGARFEVSLAVRIGIPVAPVREWLGVSRGLSYYPSSPAERYPA